MAQSTSSIDEVHSAFVDARGWAKGARTVWIRRRVRRLAGCDKDFYNPDRARLQAYRHELADRGRL